MDTNILQTKNIPTPNEIINYFKLTKEDDDFINESRKIIQNILIGEDNRLLVIVGPCSIHDIDQAIEYANYLKTQQEFNNLFIVMRVYFEKPRSRHGWKGFVYDPNLDESFDIASGLLKARKLLYTITQLRIPIACEFLDTITPQYFADLVSWGAIGARTSESQIHRQLASGLSMPIGFKNLTNGDYKKAIDGMKSSNLSHQFLGIDYSGRAMHVTTKGNQYAHLILRGGDKPNYYQENIDEVTQELIKEKVNTGIIIDCSHGNSQKEFKRQILVALSIKRLINSGRYGCIRGIMIESHIKEGNQKLIDKTKLSYGVSITDGCINMKDTSVLLNILNNYNFVKPFENIMDLRAFLYHFEDPIIKLYNNDDMKNMYLNKFYDNVKEENFIINFDDELFKIVQNDILLMSLIYKRLATSEIIAQMKFKIDPYHFLQKRNDFYKLITDRDIEKGILQRINSDNNLDNIVRNSELFIKIMELSKLIQARYLEKFIKTINIGYLGNKGTFSYEAVSNFNGNYVSCYSIDDIYVKLSNKEIDFGLIPTYNSLIGSLFEIPKQFKSIGNIDQKIHLALYGNIHYKNFHELKHAIKHDKSVTLYVQEKVRKEAKNYIEKLGIEESKIVELKTTEEGCIKCIENKHSITIASINNNCNFLNLFETDIVEHNVTTFSLVKINEFLIESD